MKIRSFMELMGDVYRVSIYTEAWSQGDMALMAKYGEPEIDLGGAFGDLSDLPTFDLSHNLVRIQSESPFTQSFDAADSSDADAQAMAEIWYNTIRARLIMAVALLRTNDDTYTTEHVETV